MLKKLLLLLTFSLIYSSSLFADKLADIKTREYIKAGVKYDFKPFGFINNQGKIDGFEIDLLRYIADKMDVGLKFYQVTSQNRIPLLLEDKIDLIAASMTHKVSRDKQIDYTISYFFDGQAMLVRSTSITKSYLDFKGKKVGAIKGATSGGNFEKLQPEAKVVYFSEYPQAIRALRIGNIDAITTDLAWCTAQAKDSNGTFRVLSETLSYEPYGIGIAQNQSKLRDELNFIIQGLVRKGIYESLYEKWFGMKPKRLPEVWPL